MKRGNYGVWSAPAALGAAIAAAAALVAGCGGGGGGAAAPSADLTTRISGVVQSASGAPVAQASVRFDNLASISAATDQSGRFALNAPSSQVANSSLWVYDAAGAQIATENLSSPSAEQVLTVGESVPGSAPPPPPPLGGTPSPSGTTSGAGSNEPPPAPPI